MHNDSALQIYWLSFLNDKIVKEKFPCFFPCTLLHRKMTCIFSFGHNFSCEGQCISIASKSVIDTFFYVSCTMIYVPERKREKEEAFGAVLITSLGFLSSRWDCRYLMTPCPICASEIPKNHNSSSSICSLWTTTQSESASSAPPLNDWSSTTWYPWDIGIIHEAFLAIWAVLLFCPFPRRKRFSRNAWQI